MKRQYDVSKVQSKLMMLRAVQRLRGHEEKKKDNEENCTKNQHQDNRKDDEGKEHGGACEEPLMEEMVVTKEECGQMAREALSLMDIGGEARLDHARNLLEQVVKGREKHLGPYHANTLKSITILGSILRKQNKTKAACWQYEKAVDGYVEVFGLENKDTLNCMNSLAELHNELGDDKKATDLYRICLRGKEKVYGDHESTFNTANHLANLIKKSNLADARDVYVKALQGKELVLGTSHPSTINAMTKLAVMQKQLGNLREAIELYEKALGAQEKLYGNDHDITMATVKALHHLLNMNSVNRKEEAKVLAQRLKEYEGTEKALLARRASMSVPVSSTITTVGIGIGTGR